MITARLEVAQSEFSAVVSATHTLQRHMGERRVVKIAVQTHDDVLHRFQVLGPQHDTRHRQGIDLITRRESERVTVQLITLVIVLNGIREVDDIGRILLQFVTELNGHLLAHRADERLRFGSRRDDDFLLLILEVDELIKDDFHLVALKVECTRFGRRFHHLRRRVIAWSALGRPDAGTRHEQQSHDHRHNPICPPCLHLYFTKSKDSRSLGTRMGPL